MSTDRRPAGPRVSREEVAQRLREIAAWLPFEGCERFQAYERAADFAAAVGP